jgi:hypothetical protein
VSRGEGEANPDMPSRAQIFAAAKEVCQEIDGVDPSKLTEFIVGRNDPIQARHVGIRAWALKIAKEGFPS